MVLLEKPPSVQTELIRGDTNAKLIGLSPAVIFGTLH